MAAMAMHLKAPITHTLTHAHTHRSGRKNYIMDLHAYVIPYKTEYQYYYNISTIPFDLMLFF